MKSGLLTIVDELKRLRKSGIETIYVSESSLQKLRSASRSAEDLEKRDAEAAIASIPENIRSAKGEELEKLLTSQASSKAVGSSSPKESGVPNPPNVVLPDGAKEERWEFLRETVLNCPTCNEHVRSGYKIVFGVGDINADIFFCGEAPGADEEEQGEPFVGKAGQLLNKMIQAMGLERKDVYIGNIMNWRPELPSRIGNRPPTPEEMAFCLPYLKAQVEVVQPKLIVALGATAAKGLLGAQAFRSLREIKGQWQDFDGTPVLPTYHPSYLLRNNTNRDKRAAWEDLLKVMERAEMPISDRQRNFFL